MSPPDPLIGFCLAAGAGSRLAPLTRQVPKPLLAPAGRALVDLACDALSAAGATQVVVNAHHGAGQVVAHLARRPACHALVEPELLGTGGGLANARRRGLLDAAAVLVTCADVVVDPADLRLVAASLAASGAAAAVGLVPAAPTLARFRLDDGRARPDPAGPWASAGVYAVTAGALDRLPAGRSDLLGALLRPLAEQGALAGVPLVGTWGDAGTLRRFLAVSAGLLAGRWPYALPPGRLAAAPGGPVLVVAGAQVDPAALVAGPLVVDARARIGAGAVLTRAVIGMGAQVGAGARVAGSVLGPGACVAAGQAVVAALLPGPADGRAAG